MYGTAHAIAGIPLTKQIMPESTILLGEVPIAKYGLPSTVEIPDSLEPFLQSHDAVLLENHGALSWGSDLMSAYFKMEGLEFYAQLSFTAQMLGGAKEIPTNEVQRLVDLRKAMGLTGKHPCVDKEGACGLPVSSPAEVKQKTNINQEALIAEITKKVMEQLR